MAQKYAKDQPLGFTNRIERGAIVGAGGQLGKFITEQLLKTGKHTITAITRTDSKNDLPNGVKVAYVDYDNESSLVSALQDQQFLIITMAVTAPPETHSKLVQAALKAGVPYIMPNHIGIDLQNETLIKETLLPVETKGYCAEIEASGTASWITLVCGMWYEYSLVMGPTWLGFDFKEKKLTLYDDGNTKINMTTFEQCGRAVAGLLSLKELPEDEHDASPTVSTWRNKPLYVASFRVSQRDMFESWKRVTGDTDHDWTVESEPSAERYGRGLAMMQAATDPLSTRMGAALASFVRIFYPNGGGDFESKYGLANGALGLPEEELDERMRVAKKMLDEGYPAWVMGRLGPR